jgi:hypothetical protein
VRVVQGWAGAQLKIEIHLNRKNGDTYVPKEILEE